MLGIPEIYVTGAEAAGLRRLTNDRETDWDPVWTHDGRIAFASFRDGPSKLYVVDPAGSPVRELRFARTSAG